MQIRSTSLYCPICGDPITIHWNQVGTVMHHKEWGYCCSRTCWKKGELKYARLILGKEDPAEPETEEVRYP